MTTPAAFTRIGPKTAAAAFSSLLVALVLSGCPPTEGGDAGVPSDGGTPGADAGGTPDAGAALAASDYCETIAPFFCDYYLRCGRMAVSDHATCLTRFAAGCEGTFEPRYVGLEEAGLLSLDATGVTQCEDHLSTVACDAQFLELAGPCGKMWQGHQVQDAPCAYDVESFVCADGLTCRVDLSMCGTCVPASAPGEPCGNDTDASCDDTGFCQGGSVCIARTLAGAACGAEDRCVLGASCDMGTCRFPTVVASGDACDSERRCPYETACIGGTCTAIGTLGEACSPSLPCAAGYCAAGICTPLLGPEATCADDASCFAGRCDEGACTGYPSACLLP